MEKITIKRSDWRRGESLFNEKEWGVTALLNDQGKMCCLGFFCMQHEGLEEDSIKNISVPWETSELWREADPQGWMGDAIDINDNAKIDEVEREHQLTKLFASQGYELIIED